MKNHEGFVWAVFLGHGDEKDVKDLALIFAFIGINGESDG